MATWCNAQFRKTFIYSHSVIFFCSCDMVYYSQKVSFNLCLLGLIHWTIYCYKLSGLTVGELSILHKVHYHNFQGILFVFLFLCFYIFVQNNCLTWNLYEATSTPTHTLASMVGLYIFSTIWGHNVSHTDTRTP